MSGFDIAGKHVGDGAPCFIVGEVAQGHHGSYDLAHAYIDAIADAGADAVKFQCHIAEAESWPDEPWRVKPKWGNETRYEYWKRMEYRPHEWLELSQHVRERGLALIVSPFSVGAVNVAAGAACPDAWKVASGEVMGAAAVAIFEDTLRRPRPVIVSSGMASGMATDEEVQAMTGYWPMALLQCTSAYPCPPEMLGLNVMAEWRERWQCPIGLSDHSGTIYAGLAAVALGCDILEVHVKLSDYDPGPDASSSITVPQLRQLVEGIRFIEKAKRPVDKDAMAKELAPMRALFMDRHKRKVEAAR